jgi:hypothetical protein
MRPTLAIGLLAAFLAGPALRLDCLISCTAIEHTASTEGCHSETSPEAKVSTGAGHCINHALPIALKGTDSRSPVAAQAPGAHPVAPVAHAAIGALDGPVTRPAASPPPLIVPLRI